MALIPSRLHGADFVCAVRQIKEAVAGPHGKGKSRAHFPEALNVRSECCSPDPSENTHSSLCPTMPKHHEPAAGSP